MSPWPLHFQSPVLEGTERGMGPQAGCDAWEPRSAGEEAEGAGSLCTDSGSLRTTLRAADPLLDSLLCQGHKFPSFAYSPPMA